MTQITAYFCLSWIDEKLSFDMITDKLQIAPTAVRSREDFPEVSKRMGLAHNEWYLTVKSEGSMDVSVLIDEISDIVRGKEKYIAELCDEYSMKVNVPIIINGDENEGSTFFLTKENIAFLASVNGEVGFDLYLD